MHNNGDHPSDTIYVHTYFISCPAAEHAIQNPDGNLSFLPSERLACETCKASHNILPTLFTRLSLLSLVLRPEEVGHLVDLRIILITSLLPRPSITANAVESLVKLLRRMMSGERLEAWLTRHACTSTAVHQMCHASQCSADVILHRGFTRPFHHISCD